MWCPTKIRPRIWTTSVGTSSALGGHSLLAMRLVAKMSAMIGTTISVKSLFTYPTIAALVAAQRSQEAPADPAKESAPNSPGEDLVVTHVEPARSPNLTV